MDEKERKRKSRLKVSGQCSKGEQIVFAFLAHLSIRFRKYLLFQTTGVSRTIPLSQLISVCHVAEFSP